MLCPSAGHGHAAASATGEDERPGAVQPEEEKAQGYLTAVYKCLVVGGRGKEDRARLMLVKPRKRRKGSGHKLKCSKFH